MNAEITWGYSCNKVIYCYSTTVTHFSLPCFSGNLPVLNLLKNSFTCSVKWGGQRFLGLGRFFPAVPYSCFRYWKFCLGFVENVREIYFCAAEHPVPLEEGEAHHALLSWPFVPANSNCLCCLSELLVQSLLQCLLWKYPNWTTAESGRKSRKSLLAPALSCHLLNEMALKPEGALWNLFIC